MISPKSEVFPVDFVLFEKMGLPSARDMRLLLTNDDGLEAMGLSALAAAVPAQSQTVMVAPSVECSGCSHQVTTDRPVKVSQKSGIVFAVHASPADCVRLALHKFPDSFDWVLAGINNGANLGVDVLYSGTVAAVREAALHGIPGIAFSQYRNRELTRQDWQRTTGWVRHILPELLLYPQKEGHFWNVNLPCLPDSQEMVPPVVKCEVDMTPMQLDYSNDQEHYSYTGSYRERGRSNGKDIDLCFGGSITVTELNLP